MCIVFCDVFICMLSFVFIRMHTFYMFVVFIWMYSFVCCLLCSFGCIHVCRLGVLIWCVVSFLFIHHTCSWLYVHCYPVYRCPTESKAQCARDPWGTLLRCIPPTPPFVKSFLKDQLIGGGANFSIFYNLFGIVWPIAFCTFFFVIPGNTLFTCRENHKYIYIYIYIYMENTNLYLIKYIKKNGGI